MTQKNRTIFFVLLLASVLVMACQLSSAVADEVSGAPEVVEEPALVEVEPTEEPSPVPDMDLSGLVLTAADFPDAAFSDVSIEEMGMSIDDLNSENFKVESFFALLEPTNFEMVMGFTTQLQTMLNKAGFDLALNQPSILLNAFMGGMGDIGASEPEELPAFEDTIGDSSAGMTVVANIEGMSMNVDIAVFRRKSIGAVVITMYLDGQQPPVSLMDVATKFDGKIADFLANQ